MTDVTVGDGGTRVTIRGGQGQRITLRKDTVAKINDARPRVIHDLCSTPVNVVDRPTNVQTGGGMGVQGRPGAPGGSVPAIAFSYGDAPGVIWTASSPGFLTYVRAKVLTAFNGAGAELRIGTLADAESVLPASMSLLSQDDEYENTPDIHLAAGEAVLIAIAPGVGATAGNGLVFLEFQPD